MTVAEDAQACEARLAPALPALGTVGVALLMRLQGSQEPPGPTCPPCCWLPSPGSDAAQGAPAPESWGELGRAEGPGCPQSRSPQGKCWFALGFPENKRGQLRGFPSGPAITTSPSSVRGAGLNPGREAKIPHASWPKTQNMKQKQYWKKFNEVFRNGSH